MIHIGVEGYGSFDVDFTPNDHKTPEEAAKAFYKAMIPVVEATGQNHHTELALCSPEQTKSQGRGNCWSVSWEAGPYEWAIVASLTCMMAENWFTEPYYSFDLCFEEI